jgi:DnaJ like chaperone protein
VWGKIIGAAAGFVLGGPWGVIMGATLGHAADTGGLAGLRAQFGIGTGARARLQAPPRDQIFAVGIVVIAAKLAKCDGPVKRAEIDAFRGCFRIPQEAVRDIGRMFDHARDSDEDPVAHARELGQAFADNRILLEDVLGALFTIARADPPLKRGEDQFLRNIWHAFDLDEAAWARARNNQPRGISSQDLEDPYEILGVSRDMADDAIRATWRQLMRDNHPDSLASHGVPEGLVASATAKVARINAAWDRIKRERGM